MPTLKQMARTRFFLSLQEYEAALVSGDAHAIVTTSIKVHASLADVPKSFKRRVTAVQRKVWGATTNAQPVYQGTLE